MSIVAEALVTNIFCRFWVMRNLHSYQRRNFEFRLLLECLGMSRMRNTPLHPQMDGMVEPYVKTAKHFRKGISTHQRVWDERLHILLLA
jgi:transposase